jgi:hypothetical protein
MDCVSFEALRRRNMNRKLNTVAAVAFAVTATPAAADFQDRTIKVANGVFETHPVADGIKVMNECVAEKSSGKMKLNPYYGGSLGGDLKGDAGSPLRYAGDGGDIHLSACRSYS